MKAAKKAPVRKRRTQEERRQTTRKAVQKATIDVLLERGYANLTTMDVAAAAGVSRGAQMNYYRTKFDLVIAASEMIMLQSVAEAKRIAGKAQNSLTVFDDLLTDYTSFFLGPTYLAMIEIAIAARTEPALNEVITLHRKFRIELDGIWLDVFVKAGFDKKRSASVLKMSQAFLRGIALSDFWTEDKSEYRRLIAEWKLLTGQLLTASKSTARR